MRRPFTPLPLLALTLAAAGLALPAPAAPPPRLSRAAVKPAPATRSFGLQLDAGAPDAAALGLLYRPWRPLRLSGSLLHNGAGLGLRGGLTLAPAWVVAPSLTLEGGHFFEANAWPVLSRYTGISEDARPVFERFGYSFASAQLGLELGAPDRFVVFVRAGLSRVWWRVRNAADAAARTIDDDRTVVTALDDPAVVLTTPSAKLGMALFF